MSRLIVKNLPAYLSDVRLREHFSQKGVVTDVKLMTRPDGTSRRFGFVGYRSEEEAKDALQYFNRTFIDTSRVQVDLARKIGDEGLKEEKDKRRANRDGVAAVEGAAPKQDEKKKDKSSKASKASNAASSSKGVSFEEFMAVMAPKKKRKTWQNEEDDPEQQLKATQGDADAADEKKERKRAKKEAKAEQEAAKVAGVEVAAADAGGGVSAEDGDDDEPMPQDEALNDEGLTDLDYMAKRMKRNVGVEPPPKPAATTKEFEQSDSEADSDDDDASSSSSDEDEESEDEESKAKAKAREEKQRLALQEKARKDQEAVDTIMGSGRLFVRNLPFAATEEDLERHFAAFGPVKQVSFEMRRARARIR